MLGPIPDRSCRLPGGAWPALRPPKAPRPPPPRDAAALGRPTSPGGSAPPNPPGPRTGPTRRNRAGLPVLPELGGPAVGDTRRGISGLTMAELAAWLESRGEAGYRTRQVADAIWRTGATSADDVATLPAALRGALTESFRWDTVASTELVTTDGGTTPKALHRLPGRGPTESQR